MAKSTISMAIFYVANCKRLPGRVAEGTSQFPASLKDFHRIVKVAAGHEEKQPGMGKMLVDDPMIFPSSHQTPLRNHVFLVGGVFIHMWDHRMGRIEYWGDGILSQ